MKILSLRGFSFELKEHFKANTGVQVTMRVRRIVIDAIFDFLGGLWFAADFPDQHRHTDHRGHDDERSPRAVAKDVIE